MEPSSMACPTHGNLSSNQCYWTRGFPSCRECVKKRSRSWFRLNKARGLEVRKAWRDANKQDQYAKKKAYRQSKPEFIRKIKQEHARTVKSSALHFYSQGDMRCALCGDGQFEHLCLDHINGGGCRHRSTDPGTRGKAVYAWVKRNNYPAGFRVLCWNCNFKCSLRRVTRTENEQSQYRLRLKLSVLSHYSGDKLSCVTCGESDMDVLTIDHVNGGGRSHLKGLGVKGGTQFYRWLKNNGYPSGYRVMCLNCNCSKRAS